MSKKFTGWRVAFSIYPALYFKKSLAKPVVLWVISMIVLYGFGESSSLDMLGWLTDFIKSAFPSILGFIVAGHALIVGFSGSSFILHLAKERKESKTTLFQDTNTTFTMVIASMVLTLVIGAVLGLLIKAELTCCIAWLATVVNVVTFSICLFVFYYSLCSLFDVVIGIFNLGQASNMIAQGKIKKLEEAKNNSEEAKQKKGILDFFKELFD